jgi:thiosulfate dehydrogenase
MTQDWLTGLATCAAIAALCAMAIVATEPARSATAGQQSADEQKALAEETTEFGEGFVISLGGKLYDDVWVTTGGKAPAGRHPAYPKSLPDIGSDSYRCPACHGWDYMGKDGHLGTAAAGVPFRSLRHLAGEDPQKIAELINAAPHILPQGNMPGLAVEILALFISLGQYDRPSFLDDTRTAKGDPARGRNIYEGACMTCHRPDGRAILTGERGDRSSLGWIGRNRPEQALHKIINGVPGAEMLSVRFLGADQLADLLAYVQTLDPGER